MGDRDSATFRFNELLKKFGAQEGKIPIREAWKKVLGVSDDAAFFEAYSKVVRLFGQVGPEIDALCGSKSKTLMKAVVKVERLFSRDLSQATHQAMSEMGDTTMALMEIAALDCQENAPEYQCDDVALRALSEAAGKLIDALKVSDLPEGLKAVLISHLSAIVVAIREFSIFGVEPIKTSVEAAFGAALVAVAQKPEQKDKEQV